MENKLLLLSAVAFFLLSSDKIKQETIDLKSIEKSMAKISDTLYACKYEANNLECRIFRNDLKSKNKMDDYKIALVDSEGWQSKYKYAYNNALANGNAWNTANKHNPEGNISNKVP